MAALEQLIKSINLCSHITMWYSLLNWCIKFDYSCNGMKRGVNQPKKQKNIELKDNFEEIRT